MKLFVPGIIGGTPEPEFNVFFWIFLGTAAAFIYGFHMLFNKKVFEYLHRKLYNLLYLPLIVVHIFAAPFIAFYTTLHVMVNFKWCAILFKHHPLTIPSMMTALVIIWVTVLGLVFSFLTRKLPFRPKNS